MERNPETKVDGGGAAALLVLFFTAVYIVERLMLQTIYVLYKEILQFLV